VKPVETAIAAESPDAIQRALGRWRFVVDEIVFVRSRQGHRRREPGAAPGGQADRGRRWSVSANPYVLEFGMGVDVHGEDCTKAACRAVSDAIRHSSLPFFPTSAPSGKMLVDVTVGVPTPHRSRSMWCGASCRTVR